MSRNFGLRTAVVAALVLLHTAVGSDLPKLSFNELIDNSELVVSGQVTRTWADWDPDHKYIWTHYEMTVSAAHKGAARETVEIAEPGGQLDGIGMSISGATGYRVGDSVMVFLSRMPNGYLRTAGFGQGKYVVDSGGRLHGETSLKTAVPAIGAGAAASVRSLDGMSVDQAAQLVSARVRTHAGSAR